MSYLKQAAKIGQTRYTTGFDRYGKANLTRLQQAVVSAFVLFLHRVSGLQIIHIAVPAALCHPVG
jgi:hypothetical protein